MKYILSIIILLLLCSCDDHIMTDNPVVIKSIQRECCEDDTQCIYTTYFIKAKHYFIKPNYTLYTGDAVISKFQDICGKFQINDTIKLIAEKTTYINYGYDVDK